MKDRVDKSMGIVIHNAEVYENAQIPVHQHIPGVKLCVCVSE
jgi:hypothetical protein